MKKIIVENKHIRFIENFIDNLDLKGKRAVDATLGKGNDSINLSKAVGDEGKVYSFDIQDQAIDFSTKKFKEANIKNIILIKDSHENVDKYVSEIDFVIFNLGYLPSFNKKIVTKGSSTAAALFKCSRLLNVNGIITVTLYTGHEGSAEEKKMLEDVLKNLDQKTFSIQKIEFFNQRNNPPIIYLIEKYGGTDE